MTRIELSDEKVNEIVNKLRYGMGYTYIRVRKVFVEKYDWTDGYFEMRMARLDQLGDYLK